MILGEGKEKDAISEKYTKTADCFEMIYFLITCDSSIMHNTHTYTCMLYIYIYSKSMLSWNWVYAEINWRN